MKNALFFIFIFLSVLSASSQVLATPWAEGYGRHVTGGRGGSVYKVTNTNTSGAGSLIDALSSGNRIIVIAVGGVLDLQETEYQITASNITVIFVTAPTDSGGFHVVNGALFWRGDNYIVVGGHFALGDYGYKDASGNIIDPTAANTGVSDCVGLSGVSGAFFSHNSIYAGVDENMSVSGSEDITMMFNLVAWALANSNHYEGGVHSMGGLINLTHDGLVSYLKNYFYRNRDRNLRTGRSSFELINNLFFGMYGQSTFGSGQSFVVMYNHWQKSVNQEIYNGQTIAQQSDATHGFGGAVYFEGNTRNHSVNSFIDADWTNQGVIVATPQEAIYSASVNIWNSSQVQDSVLANVGARWPVFTARDQEVINDYALDQNNIIDSQTEIGGFETASAGTLRPDVDNDGMDDNWETSKGLNVGVDDATSKTLDSDYDNIEVWMHEIIGLDTSTIPVTGIVWDNDAQTFNVGGFLDLSYTFSPGNATDQGFTLSSSNTGVISNAGAVVGEGTATLTITTDDGSFTDIMNVTVNAAVSTSGSGLGNKTKLFKIMN